MCDPPPAYQERAPDITDSVKCACCGKVDVWGHVTFQHGDETDVVVYFCKNHYDRELRRRLMPRFVDLKKRDAPFTIYF